MEPKAPPVPRRLGPGSYMIGDTCHVCLRYYNVEIWHRLFHGHWPYPLNHDDTDKLDEYDLLRESERGHEAEPDTWLRRLLT